MILELPGFDHPDLSEFLQGFQKRPNSEFRSQWPKVIVGAGDFFASSFSSRPDRRINHGWLVMEGPARCLTPPLKEPKNRGLGLGTQ